MKKIALTLITSTLFAWTGFAAKITGKSISYKEKETELEGYLAEPDSSKNPAPGFLIVHDWMGISDDNKQEADALAAKGAVAMAVDIYGKTSRPKNPDEAGKAAGRFKNDRSLLRERIKAAYQILVNNKKVDPKKIIVLGYCFGGMTALELARSGVELAGIVSYHGNLDSKDPNDANNIKGKVLVLHGAIDPFVPNTQVEAFQKEMDSAKKDYQIMKFSGAVHAFTNKKAGSDSSKGAAYNAIADERARKQFKLFISEVVGL